MVMFINVSRIPNNLEFPASSKAHNICGINGRLQLFEKWQIATINIFQRCVKNGIIAIDRRINQARVSFRYRSFQNCISAGFDCAVQVLVKYRQGICIVEVKR
jgi:hypothetical protein